MYFGRNTRIKTHTTEFFRTEYAQAQHGMPQVPRNGIKQGAGRSVSRDVPLHVALWVRARQVDRGHGVSPALSALPWRVEALGKARAGAAMLRAVG